jgi:D-alanyl-D-alanine carboxypeptidase
MKAHHQNSHDIYTHRQQAVNSINIRSINPSLLELQRALDTRMLIAIATTGLMVKNAQTGEVELKCKPHDSFYIPSRQKYITRAQAQSELGADSQDEYEAIA